MDRLNVFVMFTITCAFGFGLGFCLGYDFDENYNMLKHQKEILQQMEYKNDSLKIEFERKKQERQMIEMDRWFQENGY